MDITKDGVRTIRAGTEADASALGQLPHTAAVRAIEAALLDRSGFLRLVIENDAIVGVGCGGRQLDGNLASRGYDGEIALIYVLPKHQHQGIGADLIESVACQLTSRGMHEATAWATRENTATCRFYLHHGGRIVAERQRTVGHKVTLEYAYAWTKLSELCR